MYEFAADAGEMERSKYFGFSKDLYHFDHFLGQSDLIFNLHFNSGAFLNSFSDMIGCQSFELGALTDYDAELKRVEVQVIDQKGSPCGPFAFLLCLKSTGRKKGCWMTKVILRRPVDS